MTQKHINIEIPDGYEIDEKLSTFQKIVFKPIIPKITAEQRMLEIWRSCNNVKYSSNGCRTYLKDNEPMFQQDWNNKKLYYRYSLVYEIIKKEFGLSENSINNLVISTLSKDINCNNLVGRLGLVGVWVAG